MSGAGLPAGGIEVDAENWVERLAPDLPAEDAAALGPDRDILFEALVELVGNGGIEGAVVEMPEDEATVAADAALMLPGARLHIRATPEVGPTVKDLVKIALVYVIAGGSLLAGGVALSIDLGYRMYEKATKLDEQEVRIVMTLLDLRRGQGAPPTMARVEAALPDLEGLDARLAALVGKGVVAEDSGAWAVYF
jgi:hypothetical protein